MTDIEYCVGRMFASDVRNHRMIVKHDQGVYRHLVFQRREHAWRDWFELVTTPGMLTISGDRGTYSFRRLHDMFQFFRCNPDRPHRIDASYWAEKVPGAGEDVNVKAYSEDVLREHLDEALREMIAQRDEIQKELDEENEQLLEEWREEYEQELAAWKADQGQVDDDPSISEDAVAVEFEPMPELGEPPELGKVEDWPELLKVSKIVEESLEEIQDYDDDGYLMHLDGARELLRELERIGLVSDTWEWDLTDWDFRFLWCLNAIAWGIQQYDRAVRDGRHIVRSPLIPWDTPLQTTPPAEPEPPKTPSRPQLPPIKYMVTVKTTEVL